MEDQKNILGNYIYINKRIYFYLIIGLILLLLGLIIVSFLYLTKRTETGNSVSTTPTPTQIFPVPVHAPDRSAPSPLRLSPGHDSQRNLHEYLKSLRRRLSCLSISLDRSTVRLNCRSDS